MLLSRAVAGIGAGLYSPTAAAVAALLVATRQRGRALSIILGGLSVGTVVGVPFGLLLAEHHGWRSAFWVVSVVDRFVTPIVWVSLLFNIASLGLNTYVAPGLRATAGITEPTVYLWVWGLGGIVGAFAVGPFIDRVPNATRVMPVVLGLFIAATAVLTPAGSMTVIVVVALACWGAAGFASPPPQQHLLLERAPDTGAEGVAVNSSAIYLGSAIGSALGGIALHAELSPSVLPPGASAIALLATVVYFAFVIRPRSHG